jgi:2-keto-3-deoxy-L-arabinonate dehydratase
MTGGGYPDGIRKIVDAYTSGDTEGAAKLYEQWLPLINYENRQCGLAACKALMMEGGVIHSDTTRHPFASMHPSTRAGLLKVARRLDPLVLSWGK